MSEVILVTSVPPIIEIIISEMTECQVCGERDYIEVVINEETDIASIICLSCGYDGSETAQFPLGK